MKKQFLPLFFLGFFLVGCQTPKASKNQEVISRKQKATKESVKLYRGPWFDIQYPESFTVKPVSNLRIDEETELIQKDEAYFISPNERVEFYVFSPLWRGEPSYLTVLPTEDLVSEKNEEAKERAGQHGKRQVCWVSVKAKDSSYYRSFVSIKDQVGTESELHHGFGIKYRDNEAYQRYQKAYIAFKKSLRQYSD